MEKEITVQELIDQLNKIENKSMPIDVQMEECYGKEPTRYRIKNSFVFHKSDVNKEIKAVSLEFQRGPKSDIVTDIVDGYEPLTKQDCAEAFSENMSEEDKELVTTAINYERKSKQKFANIKMLSEQHKEGDKKDA